MAATNPEKHKVGDVVEAAEVQRPDGSVRKVTRGGYVLDVPGTFLVDGSEVEVGA